MKLQGVGELEIHLDTEIAHWDLVALGRGRKSSIQLDPSQAESVSPIDVLRRSDQKVAGSICSECRQELHRLRTRSDRGRSAVDRSH